MLTAGLALAGPAVCVSAPVAQAQEAAAVPVLPVTVVARFPHDPGAFTEGLIWNRGSLYESVGKEGVSEIRRVRLVDGRVLARATIPAAQFGEGLAAWHGDLISLTWHDGIAYRWDAATLRAKGRMHYPGEGWGLANNGKILVMSDGTPSLRVLDPKTFAEQRRIPVTIRGRALPDINELEFVHGTLLANLWRTPYILRIDPLSGKVTALIDLRPLVAEMAMTDPDAVPNGIAWDAAHNRLFVTGKLWPTLFEIRIAAAP